MVNCQLCHLKPLFELIEVLAKLENEISHCILPQSLSASVTIDIFDDRIETVSHTTNAARLTTPTEVSSTTQVISFHTDLGERSEQQQPHNAAHRFYESAATDIQKICASKTFQHGWTLQELLEPRLIQLWSKDHGSSNSPSSLRYHMFCHNHRHHATSINDITESLEQSKTDDVNVRKIILCDAREASDYAAWALWERLEFRELLSWRVSKTSKGSLLPTLPYIPHLESQDPCRTEFQNAMSGKTETQKIYVRRAVYYVAVALRLLAPAELLQAVIAVIHAEYPLSLTEPQSLVLRDISDLMELCGELLIQRLDGRIDFRQHAMRFFLAKSHLPEMQNQHQIMASVCLEQLKQSEICAVLRPWAGFRKNVKDTSISLFYLYVLKYWDTHYRLAESNNQCLPRQLFYLIEEACVAQFSANDELLGVYIRQKAIEMANEVCAIYKFEILGQLCRQMGASPSAMTSNKESYILNNEQIKHFSESPISFNIDFTSGEVVTASIQPNSARRHRTVGTLPSRRENLNNLPTSGTQFEIFVTNEQLGHSDLRDVSDINFPDKQISLKLSESCRQCPNNGDSSISIVPLHNCQPLEQTCSANEANFPSENGLSFDMQVLKLQDDPGMDVDSRSGFLEVIPLEESRHSQSESYEYSVANTNASGTDHLRLTPTSMDTDESHEWVIL